MLNLVPDRTKFQIDIPLISFLFPLVVFFGAIGGLHILYADSNYLVFGTADTNNDRNMSSFSSILDNGIFTFVEQKTAMSKPSSVRHPGQPFHSVVFALPLRDDGKIWSGTVTFTASKPIEVEILHTYSPDQKPDSSHSEPYNAVLPGNKSIAITQLRDMIDVPLELNGTGISSGSINFAGNALVFHKTNGEPFTVTYTIDGAVKEIGIQN